MGEERVTEVETRVIVEGTYSDTRIVSDIGEGEMRRRCIEQKL